MSSFGVTDNGFVQKGITDIKSEIEAAEKETLGADVNTLATSVIGQLNGIFSDQMAQLWEVATAVYNSQYPDSATGASLENIAALTGIGRRAATGSTTTVRITMAGGSVSEPKVVPTGTVLSTYDTGERFLTTQPVTHTAAATTTFDVPVVSEKTGAIAAPTGSINIWEIIPLGVTPQPGKLATSFAETRAFVDGQTVQISVNEGPAQTATFNATAAQVAAGGTSPFALADSQTLTVRINDGSAQNVTFLTASFADIANATPSEVAAVIDAAITGGTASAPGGVLTITSDTKGTGSSVEVTGGTANPVLAFPTSPVSGSGDFVNIAAATIPEIKAVIDADIQGVLTLNIINQALLIVPNTPLPGHSTIERVGGTETTLGFPTGIQRGTPHNISDAVPGKPIETDAELRLRRDASLATQGNASLEAIRSDVKAVAKVVDAFVFENPTDLTDAFNRPPHSIEVLVDDVLSDPANNTSLAAAIFNSKAAGIATHREPTGETAGPTGYQVPHIDSQNQTHQVNFTRVKRIRIQVKMDLYVEAGFHADVAAAEAAVKAAVAAEGLKLKLGEDIKFERFKAIAFTVPGVWDVQAYNIGTAPGAFPGVPANITIDIRERANFDTADMAQIVLFDAAFQARP